ncbi:MAG TPA: FAD-dependent oxidoreductase [Caulobacteraceae bacterium]
MEDVVVAGSGVTGLAVALAAARRGLRVRVCDPAPLGDNASGVAAGMLAPAFEAALDPLSADHFKLFRTARDLWPDFAPVEIARDGALYVGSAREAAAAKLAAVGAAHEVTPQGVFTPEDWRLEPLDALAVLRREAEAAGVVFADETVVETPAARLVLATGAARGLAPELAALMPIKGHILRLDGGPVSGPVIRGEGVYVCPSSNGALAGGTMEEGLGDRAVDDARAAALHAAAAAVVPELGALGATARAAVRAGTPDGLPLAGPSLASSVVLAVGMRRNGWLLAPLVARVTAAYLAGEDPGPHAAQLDAKRFSRGAS